MSLLRVAALIFMCGTALSTFGKSATPQNSATTPAAEPDDIPKSIAESVSGTLSKTDVAKLGNATKLVK